MNTARLHTCPKCGNELSHAVEFCPICMLRVGIADGVESESITATEQKSLALPEQRFEHYELVKDTEGAPLELGRGAMGVTYKAVDVNLHRSVALKIISEKYLRDDAVRLRFLREARAAASIRHPNVASVFHLGKTESGYFRGWARSASGDIEAGISWINEGIEATLALGTRLMVQYMFALKAEALHLADRTIESLEALNEADALVKYSEERWLCAEIHRLRGIFLAASTSDELRIETAFLAAIDTAKRQKSVSFARRAEVTFAEYLRQRATGLGKHGLRLPL